MDRVRSNGRFNHPFCAPLGAGVWITPRRYHRKSSMAGSSAARYRIAGAVRGGMQSLGGGVRNARPCLACGLWLVVSCSCRVIGVKRKSGHALQHVPTVGPDTPCGVFYVLRVTSSVDYFSTGPKLNLSVEFVARFDLVLWVLLCDAFLCGFFTRRANNNRPDRAAIHSVCGVHKN